MRAQPPYATSWSEHDFAMFTFMCDFLKVERYDVSELNHSSALAKLYVIANYWKTFYPVLPEKRLFQNAVTFLDPGGLLARFAPKTTKLLAPEVAIARAFERSIELAQANRERANGATPTRDRDVHLPVEKVSTVLLSQLEHFHQLFIDELLDNVFANPEKFMTLPLHDRNQIVGFFLDLHVIFRKMSVFEVRFKIRDALRQKRAPSDQKLKTIFRFGLANNVVNDDLFWYCLPLASARPKSLVHIEIFGHERQLHTDANGKTWAVVHDTAAHTKEVVAFLRRQTNLGVSSGLDLSRRIYRVVDDGGTPPNFNNIVESGQNVYNGDTDYHDYMWAGARKTVQGMASDIISQLSASTQDEWVKFIERCLDAIFSYQNDAEDTEIFLIAWSILESVGDSMRGINFNDRMRETLRLTSRINSPEGLDDELIEEMVIFRNGFIHGGGHGSSIRLGLYNAILLLIIGNLTSYVVRNHPKMTTLTLAELFTMVRYYVEPTIKSK